MRPSKWRPISSDWAATYQQFLTNIGSSSRQISSIAGGLASTGRPSRAPVGSGRSSTQEIGFMSDATPPRKRPVTDFHVHVVNPDSEAYDESANHNVLTGFGMRPMAKAKPDQPGWFFYSRTTDPALQIKEQQALGIDRHVISLSTVSQSSWWAEPQRAARLDRTANERIAQWVGEHPDHLIGSFTLPMQDMKLALRELDYAVATLGLKVVNMSS